MRDEKTWANLIQSLCGAYHWSSSERKPRPKSVPRSLFEIADYRRTKPQAGVALFIDAKQELGYAAAFVSAGVIIITSVLTRESLCGSPPPPDATGLYHLSILRF
jgi:hypothetical protein